MVKVMAPVIGVLNESVRGETRVALVPDLVKKLASLNIPVCVEKGAGVQSSFSDDIFEKAGATVLSNASKFRQRARR